MNINVQGADTGSTSARSADAAPISRIPPRSVLLIAGLGGTLPTLCRLATSYAVNPNQSFPAFGSYVCLILFFVIGLVVVLGFGESELKKAFVLGIAGPAVVTSILNGTTQTHTDVTQVGEPPALSIFERLLGVSDAYAAGPAAAPAQTTTAAITVVPRQLTISTSLVGAGAASLTTPMFVHFLAKDGHVISTTPVSPSVKSIVDVPSGATAVQASVGTATATAVSLGVLSSAQLNVKINAAPKNDFLWALGANRSAAISNLSASLSNIRGTTQGGPSAPPAGSTASGSATASSTSQSASSGSRKEQTSR